jgi:hypothetical protein
VDAALASGTAGDLSIPGDTILARGIANNIRDLLKAIRSIRNISAMPRRPFQLRITSARQRPARSFVWHAIYGG